MLKQPVYSDNLSNDAFLDWLFSAYPQHLTPNTHLLLININQQTLFHLQNTAFIQRYSISSASNGTGSQNNSGQTPLGAHCIREKFGDNLPAGRILKGRQDTGRCATILSAANQSSDADNITSRILWLSGLEPGLNQGGNVDTYQRYIYIHGTDEEGKLGQPASHGCIRMSNQGVIRLYEQVSIGSFVYIYPH